MAGLFITANLWVAEAATEIRERADDQRGNEQDDEFRATKDEG
jgi:hypothetical protein